MVVSLSSPLASATTGGARRVHGGYSVIDAVVVGGLLISLLRHSDRVAIARQAQLANVIAPDPHRTGRPGLAADHLPPVRPDVPAGPGHGAAGVTGAGRPGVRDREVPVVDAVATHDPATGALTVFMVTATRRHRWRWRCPCPRSRPA